MRKISDIYTEYKIIPSLGQHMYRVAAVASIICDNFDEPLLKDDIITACLLHDMGNIIKFKMDTMPEIFNPEGVEYWQGVKDEYIKKYNNSEHDATVTIMRELNISEKIVALADRNRFALICEHRDNSDMNVKIVHYSDGRVTPYGVVSYEERMDEAKKRYENHENSPRELERKRLVDCGLEIEKQIFAKCKINPEDITDELIAPIIESLKDFMIK